MMAIILGIVALLSPTSVRALKYESILRLAGTEKFYKGAVSSEHPRCSEIGVEIMTQGGSAMDGAIASLLCLGVINNFATGIGGGGFMLVRDAHGIAKVIDFREVAASSAHRDMFNRDPSLAVDSTLAAGVPGEIKGFATAHKLYGRLPWPTLFKPAIELAAKGFPVTAKLESMIEKFATQLWRSPAFRAVYFHPDGAPKKKGDIIYRPNLAKTLMLIAEKGPNVFYKGSIAKSIARYVAQHEGGITEEDLANYKVKVREPLIQEFGDFRLITSGAPTSGPIVMQLLQVIRLLGLKGDPQDASAVHQMIEAFKFAYVDRMKLGDPDKVPNMDDIVEKIVSQARAMTIVDRIDSNATHPPEYYLGHSPFALFDQHGTTHLSVMDPNHTIAATSTINLEWGCRRMDPVTGVALNNQLDDFSIPHRNNSFGLPASKVNYIGPGKRPLSSSAPIILEYRGKVLLTIGAAGGSHIITSVAKTLINLLAWGMDPDDAMEACRLHHQLLPDMLVAEDRCDRKLLRKLSHYGHQITVLGPKQYASSVTFIVRQADGAMIPVSDLRKGGIAAGY